MGKVYFYALDLARISASQALLMGKVPTTKLDLARSGPFAPLRALAPWITAPRHTQHRTPETKMWRKS